VKRYEAKTKIISGAGSLSALKELGAKRLLVVTDPYFYDSGEAAAVAEKTGAAEVEIFREVAPDPGIELAAAGTARIRAFAPDLIIALGGGSAMDCAKAMKYFSGTKAKLVAVPTTSGSGSEVTDFAILTHNGVKHPLVDASLRPDLAILDDRFLQRLPKSLIADSGFDCIDTVKIELCTVV
jgi:alcohol dehydrogenase class IV